MRGQAGVWCVAMVLAGLSGLAGTRAARGDEAPLRWGADREGGAPYIYMDPANPDRVLGFEVDLAEALGRVLGRRIEFRQYDYKNLLPGLERGDFELAMNGLEVTPERQREVRFSRPYYIYSQQLVVRAEETRIARFEDCVGRRELAIGTLDNTAAERLLRASGLEPRLYSGQLEPYRDLELGRLDGVLMDLPIAQTYARPNRKLKFAGPRFAHGEYAIALRKGAEGLAVEVDRALETLIQSGELQRIYERWELWNEDQLGLAKAQAPRGDETDLAAESARRWTFGVYFPELLAGARMTIFLSVWSMSLAIGLGMLVAVCRMYGPLPVRWLAVGYVEFFRGIPVLLLLFFIYFALPEVADGLGAGGMFRLRPTHAAILAFGMNYAAFEAEIYRAGIGAIPAGQWEAAASLGMPSGLTFRRIILPQAIRTILPPTTNDFVALFKDTSVVSVVSVIELTKQYEILSKSSLKYLEIGLTTAALYLVMSVPLGLLSRWLERRWGSE